MNACEIWLHIAIPFALGFILAWVLGGVLDMGKQEKRNDT